MKNWQYGWVVVGVLAGAMPIIAQDMGADEETPSLNMIVEDEGAPSLLDSPTGGASLDGPSLLPTMTPDSMSVLPGLDDEPEMPKLTVLQMTEVKVAVNFTWNDLSERRFAVLQIQPDGDFVQLLGMPTGLALDYPLVTDRQKLLAKQIFEALAKYGFTPTRVDLGDGQYSMQVPIISSKEAAMDAIAVVMKEGFSIPEEVNLKLITGNR